MKAGLPAVPFHDAEVSRAVLDHDGPTVELVVEVFARTPQARRYTLRFLGVSELDLDDLYTQNVLFDLEVEPVDSDGWSVTLLSTVGLGGTIHCAAIEHAALM
jgi:hypothetical protein